MPKRVFFLRDTSARPMRVIGLMSGTSADGVDVALVRLGGRPPHLRWKLEGFTTTPFPPAVREEILRVANGAPTSAEEIGQLHFLLGEIFADGVRAACRKFRVALQKIDLIGSHGQTVFHQGAPALHLGRPIASTLQIAEPGIIAERTGVPVVADFRPRDIAAGGQGAPLVPYVDFLLYRDRKVGRIALNIGGIANLTAIPPRSKPDQVLAFDTGPGNMPMDELARHFTQGQKQFDPSGKMARRGRVLPDLLAELMKHRFFSLAPPKSAGREQFGASFVARILEWSRRNGARTEDVLRTTTELTAISIVRSIERWVFPRFRPAELIVSGGGVHNRLLMNRIAAELKGVAILGSEALGVPEDAKEAMAFAILAYETFHGRPANLPSATGARHPVVLGKLIYGSR